MARAAKFIVIDDPNQFNPDDFSFQVPPNCYLNAPGILTWMMNMQSLGSDVSMKVFINNVQVYDATYTSDRYGPLHEVVNPNTLKWGNNTISFQYGPVDDATMFVISDVVLWIEVNV